MLRKLRDYFKKNNINAWATFYFLIYIILLLKFISLKEIDHSLFFKSYSVIVGIYLLSRFALSLFQTPDKKFNLDFEPTITFGIPSKNEGENIRSTILKIAQSDYPKEKMKIITINDGSTDDTLKEMKIAKKFAENIGVRVEIINWKKNRGKREGMAECIKKADSEIIIFIDSDSFVRRDTAKELVKYFINKKIGAVAGHAYVANEDDNILTKMQAVRYFVSFKAFKAAESIFGLVTCCSGCCAAYRREYIIKLVDQFTNQKFLGAKCTYGDDRSLTNLVLRNGYETVFSPTAISYTVVPNTFRQFMRQQLRWKKSWTKESINAAKFMWRKNPIASISFYLSLVLPFIAPFVMIRTVIWHPITRDEMPYYYFFGLLIVSVMYGIYYAAYTKDKKWIYGAFFTLFYSVVLSWQLFYAILTIRDTRWGTR